MKRFLFVLAALAPLGTGACNKPTPEDCRKAILHWEELLGTGTTSSNTDIEAEVRRCRGGSRSETVACVLNAKTLDELNACNFRGKGKKPDKDTATPTSAPPASAPPANPPAPGSATPSTTPDTPSK